LEYKSAHERVAYRLVFLASRFGKRRGSSVVIDAPLTHEFISESINLSRETVSRQIEKLENENLISRKDGQIIIMDIDKLSKEFSEPITLSLWGLKDTAPPTK
jgi:CRP-like cAMP-binding protein